MKQEKKQEQLRKFSFMKALLMMVFSLFSLAVSAQNPAVSATAVTPGKTSNEKATNANLAEFVKNNPSDAPASQALRYAMILDNPAAYPEFTQTDLDRMTQEQKSLMTRFNFIDQKLKDGESYEKASAIYQREMDKKAAMDKATNPERSVSQPANNAAPVMLNGNN